MSQILASHLQTDRGKDIQLHQDISMSTDFKSIILKLVHYKLIINIYQLLFVII